MKEMTHCVILSGRMARKMSSCCRGSSLSVWVCVVGGKLRGGEGGRVCHSIPHSILHSTSLYTVMMN